MVLLDVLIAVVWDSHVHHRRAHTHGSPSTPGLGGRRARLPTIGHKQVTDAHLLILARRHAARLLTFDSALHTLAGGGAEVIVLAA